jgi:hypothetical protein
VQTNATPAATVTTLVAIIDSTPPDEFVTANNGIAAVSTNRRNEPRSALFWIVLGFVEPLQNPERFRSGKLLRLVRRTAAGSTLVRRIFGRGVTLGP